VRCQRCPKPATLHITEIMGPKQLEELHFCEDCAQKHLYEQPHTPLAKATESKPTVELDQENIEALNKLTCPHCGITFKDFRSTGRLGCPQDYEVFRAQLIPLLDNIHGEMRHQGKSPRRKYQGKQNTSVLGGLRRQLQGAIAREDYELAAQLRDKIRGLETAN
jgi:protein arginine kinase activator